MDHVDRAHEAAAIRRAWLSTAATAAAAGILMMVLAHGALAVVLDIAGAGELLAAAVLAALGLRRAGRHSAQDSRNRSSMLAAAALITAPILLVGIGIIVDS